MTKIIKLFYLLIFVFILSIPVLPQGYRIEVKIEGIKDTSIVLAYHFGEKKLVKDTIYLDNQGEGVFEDEKKLDAGIYLLALPNMNFFELIIDEDQEFSVSTDTTDLLKFMKFTGSAQNSIFIEYQRFMAEQQKKSGSLSNRWKLNKENPDSLETIREEMNMLDRKVKDYWNKIISENEGMLISSLINAIRPPEPPDFEIPDNIVNKDSMRWVLGYNYNKNHFLDSVDFSDQRLLRTPVLKAKIDRYFNNVLIQKPDSVIPEITKIVDRCRANEKVFQYVVIYLLNNFLQSNIMGMDEVFVSVAEDYYLSGEADWVDSASLVKIRDRVYKIKPNIIGHLSKDLKMETETGEWVSLHQVNAKYTVLYFWETDCGHCKIATPLLLDIYKKLKDKGLEVFAVYTQDKKQEWINIINEKGYNWINAWDPNNTTYFRLFYDIYSTPTVYLLDENKKIIAKRISVEALGKMLDSLF
ncbi:MAG: redoxin domain-containing protein [Bacteroidales bacterium]|nr:redoxin domain-containing protein [Bacteroidales bacterium]